MNQGPIWGRFMKKTRGPKSRATVPLKSHLSKHFFCVPQGLIPRRTTFKFEQLQKFEPEFENVLGYELGAHMGSIHEKKPGAKNLVSCYCTFKQFSFCSCQWKDFAEFRVAMNSCRCQESLEVSCYQTDEYFSSRATSPSSHRSD